MLNVTVVRPGSRGFLSIRPGDATGTPGASNINFGAGGPNIANSVTVQLPTSGPAAGVIDIFVNGTAGEVLIDVAGFYQSATTGAPTAFNTSRGDFPGGAIGIDENGCVVGTNPTPIDPCVIAELEVAPGSYSVFGKLTAAATSDFANRELSCTVTYRPKGSAQLAETADDASVTTFEDQTINLALHGVSST